MRKYLDGHIFKSKNCGDIELIKKEYKKNSYTIKFLDDGTIIKGIKIGNLVRGHVNNKNKRTIYDRGYLGYGQYKCGNGLGGHSKEYKLWHSMLTRCYNENYHKIYSSYKDCLVDKEWHNFQNFCRDIRKIEGYQEWEKCSNYHLDKDKKKDGNKIYSLINCMFLKASENIAISNKKRAYTNGGK